MPLVIELNTGRILLLGTSGGSSSGNVTGPFPTTDRAIASWDGTTGTALFDNPKTKVQATGSIQAQGFLTLRDVDAEVTIPSGYSWIAPSLEIEMTGSIVIDSNAELIVI